MRKWIIKILYASLSPLEQWACRGFLRPPHIDVILQEQFSMINKKFLKCKIYKSSQSEGDAL